MYTENTSRRSAALGALFMVAVCVWSVLPFLSAVHGARQAQEPVHLETVVVVAHHDSLQG